MRLEHHLVGGYMRYISPHSIIIIIPLPSLLHLSNVPVPASIYLMYMFLRPSPLPPSIYFLLKSMPWIFHSKVSFTLVYEVEYEADSYSSLLIEHGCQRL